MSNMLLITSTWGESKTFKMIPAADDCPYNEAIFDPQAKVLAIVGKQKKESFHMLPKLTPLGDVETLRIGKRSNGKDYAEERKSLESFYEYYIEDATEINDFINRFAANATSYDYKKYMDQVTAVAAPVSNIVTV